MDWLNANKEWVIFALGAALTVAIYFLDRRGKQVPPAPPPVLAPTTREPPLFATALDAIVKEIWDAPLLAREEVGRRFEGLRVRWELELRSAFPTNDGSVGLKLDTGGFSGDFAECKVRLVDYPELKSMKRKAPIIVYGRISEAKPYGVTLEDVRLEFPTTPRR